MTFKYAIPILILAATSLPAVCQDTGKTIRIATYNASLYGKQAGQVAQRLSDGKDKHAANIAKVVQTIRPDVLLINEIDYDADGTVARLLNEKFFGASNGHTTPIAYPYVFSVPTNTGVDSKLDLNNNQKTGEPSDAWGYGTYPGQYAMAVFSRYPIVGKDTRTFQKFLWKDLPGALQPKYPRSGVAYYDDEVWNQLRLSSKNHIDVPIRMGDVTLHVLASHPTPPVFDGPEDRNGCRNHDEIKFWSEYLKGPSAKLKDDNGTEGGLPNGESFVIMGDLNSDSIDGDGRREAIVNLIEHDRVQDPQPQSEGAVLDAKRKRSSAKQKGNPALDTAGFNGNLRVDYVLPSRTLIVKDSGVVWPEKDSPLYEAVKTTDHRMVWIDAELPK